MMRSPFLLGRRWAGALMMLLLLGQSSGSSHASVLRSAPPCLTVAETDDGLLVSFDLRPSTWRDIDVGLDAHAHVNVTYYVELQRATRLWIDRTVDQATVHVRAACREGDDICSVSRRATGQPIRTFEGVSRGRVHTLVTGFADLPLFGNEHLERGVAYRIRIRASFLGGDGLIISTPFLSERTFTYRRSEKPMPVGGR